MRHAYLLVVLAVALVLTGCQSAPTYPVLEGTWTDNSGRADACNQTEPAAAQLTLAQDGPSLSGSLYIQGTAGSNTSPFNGQTTTAGRVTGSADYAGEGQLIADLQLSGGTLSGTLTDTQYTDCGTGVAQQIILSFDLTR